MAENRFKGTYPYNLDDRGRLVVPARFRDAFRAGGTVVMWDNDSLALFIPEDLDAHIAEAMANASNAQDRLDLQTIFNSDSFDVELDRQGRILLTNEMKTHAHIQQAVSLVGNGDHLRIWNPEAWEKAHAQLWAQRPAIIGRSR